MKDKLQQLEQKALQAMMDPHFIFNVINTIQHFINIGDKLAANHYLTDFAKLIRISSGFSKKSSVLLEEEIAYLQLYLSFEKLRFGENLSYDIIVKPAIDTRVTSIAVMMIQPFLENAIWHGILPLKTKGHVCLEIDWESANLLKIKVSDTGIGIKEQFIAFNLLDQLPEIPAPCIAIQRLKLMQETTGQKLYMRYSYLNPELKNKGSIAEFLLPANIH